jgi:hypothetical protein
MTHSTGDPLLLYGEGDSVTALITWSGVWRTDSIAFARQAGLIHGARAPPPSSPLTCRETEVSPRMRRPSLSVGESGSGAVLRSDFIAVVAVPLPTHRQMHGTQR